MERTGVDTILIVDDDRDLVRLLASALADRGYRCVTAERGGDALTDSGAAIDLAIVDVRLPDIDGVDLAAALKRRAEDEPFLPVLAVTGAHDVDERVRALTGGCDDVLTKPVHVVELEARVRALLARRRQHADLVAANARLRELHKKQQDLAALVVHDLRNPLSAIQGNVELLMEELADADDLVRESLSDCHKLASRALFLVAGLLDVEELSEGLLRARVQRVRLADLVDQATPHHKATIRMRDLRLDFDVPEDSEAEVDPDLIGRLIENLLDNAVRYAPRGGRVAVAAALEDGELVVRVGNDGPPVPDTERERIFDRYYRLEARRAGARANRGLGLYFCKLVADAHGGSIDVVETPDLPACFLLRIPQPPRLPAE